MAGLSSLATAVSGLQAAQAGLYTTGHNISNVDTRGFVRQQVMQSDFLSVTIGHNSAGTLQLGLGTNISAIRQIRDKYLDLSYREQSGRSAFYNVKYQAGLEIETIIGELEGQYRFEDVLSDMWKALNSLSIDPTGLETRGMFITTAQTFINKVNNIYERTYEYQRNLNDQVKASVQDLNSLLVKVDSLNKLIAEAEASGDNANDYRDSRAVCLDDISRLVKITYKERSNGTVDILMDTGQELLVGGNINHIGLRYSSDKWDFVEPCFTTSTEILSYDPTNQKSRAFFNYTSDVNASNENDYGSIKALIISRGLEPANYTMTPGSFTNGSTGYFNVASCLIPRVQMELDTMVNAIVTMINDVFSPYVSDGAGGYVKDYANAPYGLDDSQFTEIFVRKASAYRERFDAAGNLIAEDPNVIYSLYTIGNIEINPLLLNSTGYNKIPVSKTGDASNNQTILDTILKKWGSKFIGVDDDEKTDVEGYYQRFISRLAISTNEAKNYASTQDELVMGIDNKRKSISGVSMDEEMKNMLVYQHAYNASSRIINVIDSMIDKLVNGTGRVGR